jgi:hypothetical protein
MRKIIGIIGLVGASFFGGCGQGPSPSGPPAGELGTSSDSLDIVNGCIAQAKICATAAKSVTDGEACRLELRACLAPLVADAGSVTIPPVVIPPIDAALPPVPDPAKVEAAVRACVDTLRTCLSGSTDPVTCADQARTCLIKAI